MRASTTTVASDAVVVGAGPAGCAAAYDLAAAGFSVSLLDRSDFPRLKPCGGALTVKAVQALRFPVTPVVRHVAHDFIAAREHDRRRTFRGFGPLAAMTVRTELDAFVLETTIAAGARFHRIGKIRSIDEQAEQVDIVTDEAVFRAAFVIGADGANSTVRRLLGAFPDFRAGFAIEGQVFDAGADGREVEFDFGVVPRGYAWVFPKGDHYNVGIYTCDARFALSPVQLNGYLKQRMPGARCEHIVGHRLGIGGWDYTPDRERVFLVGDAAGLVEPILGEGIYYAIRSGQHAAAAVEAGLRGLDTARRVFAASHARLAHDVCVAQRLATTFYRDLGLGCLTLSAPPVRYLLMKGYSAGIPLGEIVRRALKVPFAAIPELAPLVGAQRALSS